MTCTLSRKKTVASKQSTLTMSDKFQQRREGERRGKGQLRREGEERGVGVSEWEGKERGREGGEGYKLFARDRGGGKYPHLRQHSADHADCNDETVSLHDRPIHITRPES